MGNSIKKYNKTTLAAGIIVALAGIYTASSWFIGNQIKNEIENGLNVEIKNNLDNLMEKVTNELSKRISEEIHLLTDVNFTDFKQGLFSSSVKVKISIKEPTYGTAFTIFNDDLQIYHGPFPFYSLKQGDFSPSYALIVYELKKELDKQNWTIDGNKSLLTMESKIHFDKDIGLTITNPSMEYKRNEYEKFITSANKLTINYSKNNQINNIKVDGNIKKVELFTSFLSNVPLFLLDNFNFNGLTKIDVPNNTLTINNNLSFDYLSFHNFSIERNVSFKLNAYNENDRYDLDNFRNGSGDLNLDVQDIKINKHNIGNLISKVSYNFEHKNDQYSKMAVNITDLVLENKEGKLQASLNTELEGKDLEIPFNEYDAANFLGNINRFEANINLPIKPLSYFIAQGDNINQEEISPTIISKIADEIFTEASKIAQKTSFINIKNDENDINSSIIESNIAFVKDENKVVINGKSFTPESVLASLDGIKNEPNDYNQSDYLNDDDDDSYYYDNNYNDDDSHINNADNSYGNE